jgi:Rrf2 family protein
MMLSARGKYGLKAMIHLAEAEGMGGIQGAAIADEQNIPKKFLDTILLELKNNGLVHSKKGKGGGYSLAKPAGQISIGQIIRILDGPLAAIACASRTAYRPCVDCPDVEACRIRQLMSEVRDATAAILDNTSLATLTGPQGRKRILSYDI